MRSRNANAQTIFCNDTTSTKSTKLFYLVGNSVWTEECKKLKGIERDFLLDKKAVVTEVKLN